MLLLFPHLGQKIMTKVRDFRTKMFTSDKFPWDYAIFLGQTYDMVLNQRIYMILEELFQGDFEYTCMEIFLCQACEDGGSNFN